MSTAPRPSSRHGMIAKAASIAAAVAGLMLASCARFHEAQMHDQDARIARLTKDYVAGRISAQRYHDLCNVVSGGWRFAKSDAASGGSSTSDSSSTASDTTPSKDDVEQEKKKGDLAHQRAAGAAPACPLKR